MDALASKSGVTFFVPATCLIHPDEVNGLRMAKSSWGGYLNKRRGLGKEIIRERRLDMGKLYKIFDFGINKEVLIVDKSSLIDKIQKEMIDVESADYTPIYKKGIYEGFRLMALMIKESSVIK